MANVCNLVDANISTWMPCIQEAAFFGEPLLMAIAAYVALGLILYKFSLPGELALPLGFLFTAGLYVMNPLPQLFALLLVTAVPAFGWIAFAMLSAFRSVSR